MRIAFFADNFYPELSGIVDSVLTTGAELTKRGHSVIFIGPHYSPKDYALVGKQYHEEHGSEVIDGMPIVRLPSVPLPFSPTGQSHFAFPTSRAVRKLRRWKPDIIHTHSPYGCGFEAVRAAKKLGVPLVGTNHTPVEEFYPFAPMMMRRFDAWYYNHCSFVSTPFSNLLANMREVGFASAGRAVANPVRESIFCPPIAGEQQKIREKFGLTGPVLLYSGRVAPEKHLDVALRAVSKLLKSYPKLTLVITGHGSAVISLKALAQELQIAEHVRFTGFIPTEQLALYYKAADVFVIPSTADCQSIALMQAYSTAIPAVGARSRGLIDYIPQNVGALFTPGNVTELVHELEKLLASAAVREHMGQAALAFIEKLSPEYIADVWEKIYQDALKK